MAQMPRRTLHHRVQCLRREGVSQRATKKKLQATTGARYGEVGVLSRPAPRCGILKASGIRSRYLIYLSVRPFPLLLCLQ